MLNNMLIKKGWRIKGLDYTLTLDEKFNKAYIRSGTRQALKENDNYLFDTYIKLFEWLGNVRLFSANMVLSIKPDNSICNADINLLNYRLCVIDDVTGELLKDIDCGNVYECFDALLCLLESE